MRLAVLGPPALVRDDGTPAGLAPGKTFAVLVYLAHEASPPSRVDLARVFWPDSEPARARQSVRQTLSLIRKVLGDDAFSSDDPVKLRPGVVASDVREFLEALRDGEVEAADALWRGPFGEGLALADAPEWTRWVEERQLALEGRLCAGLTAAAEAARFRTDEGAKETTEEAVRLLRRAIAIDPYRERPRTVLADLLLKLGRLDEAAHEIAEARRALDDDTESLRTLEARVEAERRRRYATGEAGPAPGLSGVFVGRTEEMGRLLGAWARVEQRVVTTAIVEGPAGIGKTRLSRELADHVRRAGGIVAFTSPLPAEEELEGGVLLDLEDQLRVEIGRATETGSRPGGRDTAASAGRPSRGGDDELAAAEELERLLRRAPASVLLVVDDLQWADPLSRSALARVRRRLDGVGCLFLFTIWSEAAGPGIQDLVAGLRGMPGTVSFSLNPLSEDEVRELVALTTRIEALEASGALERLVEQAGGSPLYVVELLRTLAEGGTLALTESGQLAPTEAFPDPLPVPRTVRELLERRLESLPDDAVTVAAHLAASSGRSGVDRLRDASGLPLPRFSRGLGALLDREVLLWASPTELAFAHEEVRRAVARRFPLSSEVAARNARRRARRLGWAAMALAAVPLLALAVVRPWREAAPERALSGPPWGGGRVLFLSEREIVELRPDEGPPETWSRSRQPVPGGDVSDLSGPFLTTSGELVLYGRVLEEGVPPRIVRIEPDGRTAEVARSEWDEGRPWLSPDGGLIAWERGRLEGDRYPHEVRVARADGSDPHTILASAGQLQVQGWAPSGRYILVGAAHPDADSLLVITPLGERRGGWEFEGETAASWCGATGRFAVRGVRDGTQALWLGQPGQAGLERLEAGEPLPYAIACSPDASGIVYARAVDGRLRLVLLDVESGAFSPFPADLDAREGLRWLPDSLPPVPVAVWIEPDSVALDWGDTLRLAARVRRSDGRTATGAATSGATGAGTTPVAWRSSDPAVVSVRPDGTVTANGPGRALVVAEAEGWLRDTARVEVRATERSDVLLQEDFSTLDPERWIVYGSPPARPAPAPEAPALALRGDGTYHDGVLSRVPFPIRGGATVEVEFRLPLRGRQPQRFQLCLEDTGPDLSEWRDVRFVPAPREAACLTYPAEELARQRAEEVELSAAGWRRTVRLPDDLPSDDWVRVGVQVRGDGMPFFYLNGRLIGAGPLRLTGLDSPTWHVHMGGKSVGTELLARRLVVWRGARFVPLTWSVQPIDNISNTFSVWVASEDAIWVAGGYRVLWHFDGSVWTEPVLPIGTQNTGTVFGFSSDDVWLAGQYGVERFDGSEWKTVLAGVGEVSGIWGTGPSDVYVSGDGRFLHFDGRAWTGIPTGLSTEWNTDRLLTVWGSATADVYVGGYDGRILHWDGARLEEVFRERGQHVHAIHGTGPDDVFAVGTNGRIWHFDGTEWARMESGTDVRLNGVYALSPEEVYVTGLRGTLLRWDGSAWAPAGSGTGRDLFGISAPTPSRVYIAAQQGALLVGTR